MKIGIITYHRSQNHGAQLQAYATKTALCKLGVDAEVLDCNTIGEESMFEWHFNSLRAFLGSIKNNVLSLVSERKRNKLFKAFSQNMVGVSKPCLTKVSLDKIIKEYDYVITGSDQVWHPQICEDQTCFFLDLPVSSNQKIAYAPSFGVPDYNHIEVEKYIPLINDIAHLSVREEKGVEIIKKYTSREAKLVVDPTMLLTREDWNEIVKPSHYKKYLFYFTILDEQPGTDALVRKIAAEKGLEIVRIGSLKDLMKPGFKNARANGPQEFLGLIRDADFVVTTSFHGTVFSILFEKEFLCVLNNNNRNSRMETLTLRLGLKKYLVQNPNVFNFSKEFEKINYEHVKQKLDILRDDSLCFLKESIGL
ncbi:polysaccharide pyruvyl transferase family protein [Bacteroides sp.]|uniref:polysaccharide pyruvyl transferase family protein n=1 Tax=Bacteroides sp. TaxID=29523 RepID=UPI002626D6C0|nr:polysaccharide pyruvyl transferase family protein [Bacteroides sp.]MDD3040476.1 polysaccharide pyruvyl transferase family protein [Bacteroides sp.]